MARLSLDQILSAPDLPEREVEVPEWGGSVKVRSLTKAAQEHLRKSAKSADGVDEEKLQMLLIVHCVVDPPMTEADIESLRKKSAAAINRLGLAIAEVCGFSGDAQKEARQGFFPGSSESEGQPGGV